MSTIEEVLKKVGYGSITVTVLSDGRLYHEDSGLAYTSEEWAEFGWAE